MSNKLAGLEQVLLSQKDAIDTGMEALISVLDRLAEAEQDSKTIQKAAEVFKVTNEVVEKTSQYLANYHQKHNELPDDERFTTRISLIVGEVLTD